MAYVFSGVFGPLALPHQLPVASTARAESFSRPTALPAIELACMAAPVEKPAPRVYSVLAIPVWTPLMRLFVIVTLLLGPRSQMPWLSPLVPVPVMVLPEIVALGR